VGCVVEGLGGGPPQDSLPDKATKPPLYKVQTLYSYLKMVVSLSLAKTDAPRLANGWTLEHYDTSERERERFTSSPTFLCGNTPATLG